MTAPHAVAPNLQRLWRRLNALAALTDPERPYTRRAFTGRYLEGREWLRQEMRAAGLSVRLDEAANLLGRLEGQDPALPPLLLGSHTDTVEAGGRFDGPLGVVAALEVVDLLREAGRTPQRPLEIIDFLSEEPSDYGASCVGSRALAGTLTPALLDGKNSAGETLREAMTRMGAQPERLTVGRPLHRPAAYLELHIEQGTRLERAGARVGVVSGFVGIQRWRLHLQGRPDHAGTTPMDQRQDALVAASQLIVAVHAMARRIPGLVATVGRIEVQPNAANAVPGEVSLVLEVRSLSARAMQTFVEAIERQGQALAEVRFSCSLISDTAPVPVPQEMQAVLLEAAGQAGLPSVTLESWAGHDAMHVAGVASSGMVFVPCEAGRSHTPDENITEADLLDGVTVLWQAAQRWL